MSTSTSHFELIVQRVPSQPGVKLPATPASPGALEHSQLGILEV